jgi:hypothetical protein
VLAAGGHLAECRLKWPDGRVTPYITDDALTGIL